MHLLVDIYEIFLSEYENLATIRSYRDILLPFVRWFGEGRDISTIEPIDVHKYIQALKNGQVRSPAGAFVTLKSPHSMYKHIKGIKRFFNWITNDLEILEKSPAARVSNPSPDARVPREKAATHTEIEKMVKVAYGNPRNYLLVLFLRDTGARAIGAANLRFSDIDLDNLKARVTEKFGKSRSVWFSDETAHAFMIWRVQRPLTPGQDYVFVSTHSPHGNISPDGISQIIYRLAKKAGIPGARGSHSLRHALGFALADAGVAVTVAANVFGHEDATVTATHYYPHDDERAEAAVREIHRRRDDNLKKEIIRLRKSSG